MPIKRAGPAESPAFVDWSGGLTWLAHPDEAMARASHALTVGPDGGLATGADYDPDVWVVDPLDAAGLEERLESMGEVTGVLVLSSYHRRDAAAVARRYGVPVSLPGPLKPLAARIETETAVVEDRLQGTSLEILPVRSWPGWREASLFDQSTGTLVVGEALSSQPCGTALGERLAVAPYARPWPPRAAFRGLDVERVLVGHGEPVLEDAGTALDAALANARRGLPAYLLANPGYALRAWWTALRA